MSGAPGWYPDPGGQPDRYRYWDGTAWSAETTGDPRRAAPHGAAGPNPPSRPRAMRWLILVTVAALLVAAGSIAVRFRDSGERQPVLFPSPTTSATGTGSADDSSPTPSGGFSSPAPRAIGCPNGAPDARAPHPADDRVHGGDLSFPRVDSFLSEAPENRMTFAYDVVQQVRTVSLDPPWIAQLALGRLLADGYPRDAEHTAELVTECIVASDMYRSYSPQRHDRSSREITVSGQDGWLITTDIVVNVPHLKFPGDHVAVVVVPDGADWGLFFGAVPIGDAALTDTLTRTVLALQVG